MLPKHRRKWARFLSAVNRVAVGRAASQALKKALLFLMHFPMVVCCGTCCGGPQVKLYSWTYGLMSNLCLVFHAVSQRGVREVLTEELGCFCLKVFCSVPELRLQECLGCTAACVLTPCAYITSHHAGEFGVIKGFEELLLCISSFTYKSQA